MCSFQLHSPTAGCKRRVTELRGPLLFCDDCPPQKAWSHRRSARHAWIAHRAKAEISYGAVSQRRAACASPARFENFESRIRWCQTDFFPKSGIGISQLFCSSMREHLWTANSHCSSKPCGTKAGFLKRLTCERVRLASWNRS